MLNPLYRILPFSLLWLLTACATPPPAHDYSAYRESDPHSILVLPPLNNTPDVRATYSVLSTVTRPLAESGYYVFPVALVDMTFKENGLANPGEMHQAPLRKLREIFGADAVLYLTVSQYGPSYQLVASEIAVRVQATLVDARTGTTLWEGWARASDAEEQSHNNNGGLAGLLITAVVKQVISNIADNGASHRIAAIASQRLLQARPNGLLYGPRFPLSTK